MKLLDSSQIPSEFRDPGITTGYRKLHQPWVYYARSCFAIHNETVNIWTHFIPCLCFFYLTYYHSEFCNTNDGNVHLPILLYKLGCMLTTGASTAAHIFGGKSVYFHRLLFQLDYAAICFYAFANGMMQMSYFSDSNTYNNNFGHVFALNFILAFFDLTVICFLKLNLTNTRQQFLRKILSSSVWLWHCLVIMFPVITRYIHCWNGNESYCSFIASYNIYNIFIILNGLIYSSQLPEKIFPGVFDIFGASHQVFHVLAFLKQSYVILLAHSELRSGREIYATPQNDNLLIISALTLFVTLIIVTVKVTDLRSKLPETKSK